MYILHTHTHTHTYTSSDGKRICLQRRRPGFDPWVEKIPWRRKWQPAPVFLPGESHGQYSPKESDTTEQLALSMYILMEKLEKRKYGQGKTFPLFINLELICPSPITKGPLGLRTFHKRFGLYGDA